MRLAPEQRQLIKRTIVNRLGNDATVRLFGSRVNDAGRGGDIDVFVDMPRPVVDRLRVEATLAAELERACDGRRVDVVVAAPNCPEQPIHVVARQTGVLL